MVWHWYVWRFFVAIALVACETPAPGVAAPTVSEEIPDTPFGATETTKNVDLSNAFKGEKLTFSVRSNNLGVAVPTIAADNRSIVITAIGPGPATITVTATNPGGSKSQSFKVTVPSPTPPAQKPPQQDPPKETNPGTPTTLTKCPPPAGTHLQIGRDDHAECDLQPGQRLISSVPDAVSVTEPGKGEETENVWTITAILRGLHPVLIYDKDGKTVGTILVRVPNTPPQLKEKAPVSAGLTQNIDDDIKHTTDLQHLLQTYFADKDNADTGIVDEEDYSYKVSYKPAGVLIATEGGFVDLDDAGQFEVVILREPEDDPFTIQLYAHDRANAPSDNPVSLTFPALPPRGITYPVGQDNSNDIKTRGNFTIPPGAGDKGKLKIGNRLDSILTIDFDGTGFVFAQDKAGELLEGERIDNKRTASTCGSNEPKGWETTKPDLGTACYSIKSDNADVGEITILTPESAPEVTFKLLSENRTLNDTGDAKITITYHVWSLPSGKKHTEDGVDKDDGKVDSSTSEALSLDIHKCVTTDDCP